MAKRAVAASVDDYIAAFPPACRRALTSVRRLVRKAVPEVAERISYGIVRFERGGKYLFYMAGWDEHVGIYPVHGALARAFSAELKPYLSGKATVRFPFADGLPLDLIGRLVAFRLGEMGPATASQPAASSKRSKTPTKPTKARTRRAAASGRPKPATPRGRQA